MLSPWLRMGRTLVQTRSLRLRTSSFDLTDHFSELPCNLGGLLSNFPLLGLFTSIRPDIWSEILSCLFLFLSALPREKFKPPNFACHNLPWFLKRSTLTQSVICYHARNTTPFIRSVILDLFYHLPLCSEICALAVNRICHSLYHKRACKFIQDGR